jgi:hypothetical protein
MPEKNAHPVYFMLEPEPHFYPLILDIDEGPPYMAFLNTDYTTWNEYKELPPEKQSMFDRAVDLIEKNPGISSEKLKLYHQIDTNKLGGTSIVRMAAGVEQNVKESQYRELEAEAVRFALSFGPDNINTKDLQARGLVAVTNHNNHGTISDFRRYVKENSFGSGGYLIPKGGPDLTGWLPGKVQF